MKKIFMLSATLLLCLLMFVSCGGIDEEILLANAQTEAMTFYFFQIFLFEHEQEVDDSGLVTVRFFESAYTQRRLNRINAVLNCPFLRDNEPVLFNGRRLEVDDFINTPLEVWEFTRTFHIYVVWEIDSAILGNSFRCCDGTVW